MTVGRSLIADPTSNRLFFEIAPRLSSRGHLLVVGQLHSLLSQCEDSGWSTGPRNALLLAAFNYHLALRILIDLELDPVALSPRRWRSQQSPRVERVRAADIFWPGEDSAKTRPFPCTGAFLADVPEEVVRQVLVWAPPVVRPPEADGTSFVVANYPSALLARQRLPDQMVEVRRLRHGTSLQRSLPEICQGIVHLLKPGYSQNRKRIAELAPNEVVAQLLSGYSRTHYFRIKDDGND